MVAARGCTDLWVASGVHMLLSNLLLRCYIFMRLAGKLLSNGRLCKLWQQLSMAVHETSLYNMVSQLVA